MTLHEVTAADAALATLRAEIERLATVAAAATLRAKPLRVEVDGRHPNEYSTEFWYEDATFRVITCDGSVGISGGPGRGLDWRPDFTLIEGAQIRPSCPHCYRLTHGPLATRPGRWRTGDPQ